MSRTAEMPAWSSERLVIRSNRWDGTVEAVRCIGDRVRPIHESNGTTIPRSSQRTVPPSICCSREQSVATTTEHQKDVRTTPWYAIRRAPTTNANCNLDLRRRQGIPRVTDHLGVVKALRAFAAKCNCGAVDQHMHPFQQAPGKRLECGNRQLRLPRLSGEMYLGVCDVGLGTLV